MTEDAFRMRKDHFEKVFEEKLNRSIQKDPRLVILFAASSVLTIS